MEVRLDAGLQLGVVPESVPLRGNRGIGPCRCHPGCRVSRRGLAAQACHSGRAGLSCRRPLASPECGAISSLMVGGPGRPPTEPGGPPATAASGHPMRLWLRRNIRAETVNRLGLAG
ncbi:hypothetical protein JOE40_000702 [Arthrobacter sp. PvP102]|nr:hypothetical protein [Arthrobacter sp. PvP103]MBP1236193.1 hypothetical protein [Arthrobacter sp. PvP102]